MFTYKQQRFHDLLHTIIKNPGLVTSTYNITVAYYEKPGWKLLATPTNITAGFKNAGVYPFNTVKFLFSSDTSESPKLGKYIQNFCVSGPFNYMTLKMVKVTAMLFTILLTQQIAVILSVVHISKATHYHS